MKTRALLVLAVFLITVSASVLATHPQTGAPGETPRGPDSVASGNVPCTHAGLPVAIANGGNVHCVGIH